MAIDPFPKGIAALVLRHQQFADSLHAPTREELFEKRLAIEMARKMGPSQMSIDEIKDLLLKELATEAEILKRYGAAGLSEYKIWRAANEPEAG